VTPAFQLGDRVTYPREPVLGVGRITGVIQTTDAETGEVCWTYLAQWKARRVGEHPPTRLGGAGDFERAR
jgi:RNA polymerase-interacting CarD/CdnL/TRCF family regulator